MIWMIVLLIFMSLVKIVLICFLIGVMEWLFSKFVVYVKLSDENVVFFLDGKCFEGEEKQKVID